MMLIVKRSIAVAMLGCICMSSFSNSMEKVEKSQKDDHDYLHSSGPRPRPALAPSRRLNFDMLEGMIPGERKNSLDSKTNPDQGDGVLTSILKAISISIYNKGDQTLSIMYWNGKDSWSNVAINSGSTKYIACIECKENITIRYDDGKSVVNITLSTGNSYKIHWSETDGRWLID